MNVRIRVFYPPSSGRMVLKVGPDWQGAIEPVEVDPVSGLHAFELPVFGAHVYFKPVIVDRSEEHWSVGPNYLALRNAGTRDIYPHFFSGAGGSITKPLDVPGHSIGVPGRPIRVYLPPGYGENHLKRYPVLYMQDGTNLFYPEEAFGGTAWEVNDVLELLDAMSLIDKLIVVGVYARDRMKEFTKPGYEAYGRFMVETLKPFVDFRFRTLGTPETTAVMGSSLGGVVSMHLAWHFPEVFGMAACMSSTFGYRDDLERRIADEPKRNIQLYIDSGWPGDNYEANRSMFDRLLASGFRFGDDLLYFAFPQARHNESAWAMRCHLPLQFLFAKRGRGMRG